MTMIIDIKGFQISCAKKSKDGPNLVDTVIRDIFTDLLPKT